jgi:NhaA family Na+:H+ antiporter
MSAPSRGHLASFFAQDAAGGCVLAAAAVAALLIANSPLGDSYQHLLHMEIGAGPLHLSLMHWINDGLMAMFFLLIGLELKREVVAGELSRPSQILLPALAALGGVIAPALIYLAFNHADPARARGWAIPAATDIAFALGALSLLGRRAPPALKTFLMTIAVLDDLAAILIIAVFYTAQINVLALALAAVVLAALATLNRLKVRRLPPYLALGLLLWLLVLKSGLHATLAGVALAMTIPMASRDGEQAPLLRLEHALQGPVTFMLVPLFGLANAGVSFAGMTIATLAAPIPAGVALGLLLGKQLGVFGAATAVIRSGLAPAPGFTTAQLYGVSLLCGIGFTMSLFIGALAFTDPLLLAETKLGVFAGSLLAALCGYGVLRLATKPEPAGSKA